jgi:predicted DCC family thiol-disulfide oxidoreductase YuxK
MHDPEADAFLATLPEAERYATWHLVRRDGSLAGAGAGLVDLVASLRLTRPAARVVALVPERALEAFYRVVARYRSRFGRIVPDGPAPRRFP